MKRLLALLLIPVSVFAEPHTIQKSIICEDATLVMNSLSQKFNEFPVLMVQSNESIIITTVNPAEDTWTTLETQKNNLCILGFGHGVKFNTELLKQFKVIE